MLRPVRISILFAALALLGASSAEAATYCVNKTPCPDSGTPHATIQAALDDATDDASAATIYIGANGGVPYTGTDNFRYNSPNPVHLIGDGVGQTILQGTGSADIERRQTLRLQSSGSSTVSDMTIHGPSNTGGGEAALRLTGTASRVALIQANAPNGIALVGHVTATLEDSTVVSDRSAVSVTNTPVTFTIRDSSIKATGGTGVSVSTANADLNLQRSDVTATARALQIGGSGTVADAYNAILQTTVGGPFNGVVGVLNGALTVRHATVVGPSIGYGFDFAPSGASHLTVRDSIIDRVGKAVLCNPNAVAAALTVAYTNTRAPFEADDNDPNCSFSLSNNDTTTVPAYVDAANADYRLIGGSPLIDAADPADPIANDFVNTARPIGGRSDMGAFEYRAQAPTAAITTAPGTATAGEEVTFAGTGADPDGDPLTFAWSFGDGGIASGATVAHSFAPGSHNVTLTVTDSAGLSTTAMTTIVVSETAKPPIGKVTGLKADPKKIKARKAAPKLVPGGAKGLLFELSAPATVTLTLERCKGERGCSKTKAVNGSAAFDAPSGASAIRFKGSLDGRRKLRRGRYIATLTPAGGTPATTKLKIV